MSGTCGTCGKPAPDDDLVLSWKQIADGRRQIEGRCPHCHAWVKFASQTPENVRRADAAPPRAEQKTFWG